MGKFRAFAPESKCILTIAPEEFQIRPNFPMHLGAFPRGKLFYAQTSIYV
ncbi:protein of unknown function [Thermococcus camini]|uniref:Uncharacterized protein n=1 Tax=Thermococcus camini TaxID=2016373 RepID=A0A7G2D5U6_9EURY|nr:protein of unknown function [Thermococcus camini]